MERSLHFQAKGEVLCYCHEYVHDAKHGELL